jgi:vancomycin permeability regulator SanA
MLAKKYADLEDQSQVPERDREVRARLHALSGLELMGRDPLAIDWKGPEGQGIIREVIAKFYKGMEDGG